MSNLSFFLKRLWRLRKFRHLTSVLLRKSGISSYFRIHVGPITLIFHPAAVSSHLWEEPNKYIDDQALFRRILRNGDICIDAGANIGLLTLTASRLVGKDGFVLSVEAHPQTHHYLKENIAVNNAINIKTHQVALGAEIGTAFFSEDVEDDTRHVLSAQGGVIVPKTLLDHLTMDLREVHLMKLDVEGYEYEVLSGSDRTLSITHCVYFESFNEQFRRYGRNSQDLIQLFNQKGFSIFFPPKKTDKLLRPIPKDHTSLEVENLLALRDIDYFLERTGFILSE